MVNNAMGLKTGEPGIAPGWPRSGSSLSDWSILTNFTAGYRPLRVMNTFPARTSQGQSFCAVVEYMFSWSICPILGDPVLADRLEKITLSSTRYLSPDMWPISDQQVNQ